MYDLDKQVKHEKELIEYLNSKTKEEIITLFLQIYWERDIAIHQLSEIGYSLGESTQ